MDFLTEYSLETLCGSKSCIPPIEHDYSAMSIFWNCPRRYFYHTILHLQSKRGSNALRFGSTLHAMLEAYYETIRRHGWSAIEDALKNAFTFGKGIWEVETNSAEFKFEDYRTFETAIQTFLEYHVLYKDIDKSTLKILSTERVVSATLETLTNEEKEKFPLLQRFQLIGKVDLTAEWNETLTIFDHKTTSMYLTVAMNDQLRSPQGLGYLYAITETDRKKPFMLASNYLHTSSKATKDGTYKTIKREFERTPKIPSDWDLQQWRVMTFYCVNQIQRNCESGVWCMNLNACAGKYGACPYVGLCEQTRPLKELITDEFCTKAWDPRHDVNFLKGLLEGI